MRKDAFSAPVYGLLRRKRPYIAFPPCGIRRAAPCTMHGNAVDIFRLNIVFSVKNTYLCNIGLRRASVMCFRQGCYVVMLELRRIIVWLCRIGRCRGFGIQSPWAYRIVRYVINEHYPYYAYGPLSEAYPAGSITTRKLRELCLRLANHVRPRTVVEYGCADAALEAYVKAGCKSAEYVRPACECADGLPVGSGFALIAPCEGFAGAFRSFADGAPDGAVAVLFGIRRNKQARRLWREIVAGRAGVVTFDLYYCGLVFFDKKRFKQNYIINF